MPYIISNLSGRLITVELHDGSTRHLAPGEVSPELDDALARPRAAVADLVRAGVIGLREVGRQRPQEAGRRASSTPDPTEPAPPSAPSVPARPSPPARSAD